VSGLPKPICNSTSAVSVGVYVAPGKEGAKADPVKEAALAAKLRDIGRIPTKSRR
jgi:hypothetical protein